MKTSEKNAYYHLACSLRQKSRQIKKSKDSKAITWIEDTVIREKQGKAIVIILPTKGCNWAHGDQGGCFMCGYIEDSPIYPPSPELLWDEFKKAMKKHEELEGNFALRIFNSGSFFDEDEIPIPLRNQIYQFIKEDKRIIELTLETRPEFVTKDKLTELKTMMPEKTIEIAMGLESSNDLIRMELINKGYSLEEFSKAANEIKDENLVPKAYLLLKPPFLCETEAIQDIIISIETCFKLNIPKISINPCTVQKGTIVEHLWMKNRYRPPWLWSILEIFSAVFSQSNNQSAIICEPTAGGKLRGAHNCGKCDQEVLDVIKRISLTQTLDGIVFPECGCKNTWENVKKVELISQRNLINLLIKKRSELPGTTL